jgi:hypothetical protein
MDIHRKNSSQTQDNENVGYGFQTTFENFQNNIE